MLGSNVLKQSETLFIAKICLQRTNEDTKMAGKLFFEAMFVVCGAMTDKWIKHA